jgi:hypothetical protein
MMATSADPREGGNCMQDDEEERWMNLCQQASTEQDPEKLLKLIAEINDLLESKEKRRLDFLTPPSNGRNPDS